MHFMVKVYQSESVTTIIYTRSRSAAFVLASCYPTLNQKQKISTIFQIPTSRYKIFLTVCQQQDIFNKDHKQGSSRPRMYNPSSRERREHYNHEVA